MKSLALSMTVTATLLAAACAPDSRGVKLAAVNRSATLATVADGQPYPANLLADDQFLYWTTTYGVMRAPLAGGEPEAVIDTLFSPAGMVADADSLYVVVESTFGLWPGDCMGDCSVPDACVMNCALTLLRIAKADGTASILAIAKDYTAAPRALAIEGDYLYLVHTGTWNPDTCVAGACDGFDLERVLRVPRAGGTPEVVAEKQVFTGGLVVVDGRVYWTRSGTAVGNSAPADASWAGGRTVVSAVMGEAPRDECGGACQAPRDVFAHDGVVYAFDPYSYLLLRLGGGGAQAFGPLADHPQADVVGDYRVAAPTGDGFLWVATEIREQDCAANPGITQSPGPCYDWGDTWLWYTRFADGETSLRAHLQLGLNVRGLLEAGGRVYLTTDDAVFMLTQP